ncbi:unnamed protein product [Clavelina lepadiformis]|uniref:Uncharacterized protein n=1 Tax=Clavelina lepadiformis TaxID=159417 RepID=A0ABP0EZR8_CLALP
MFYTNILGSQQGEVIWFPSTIGMQANLYNVGTWFSHLLSCTPLSDNEVWRRNVDNKQLAKVKSSVESTIRSIIQSKCRSQVHRPCRDFTDVYKPSLSAKIHRPEITQLHPLRPLPRILVSSRA